MIEIISHRGYWTRPEEKNLPIAFERSFSLGFGTETDFRDYKEQLVISHDVANESCITAEKFFEIFKTYNPSLPLALNIKADGLQNLVKAFLMKHNLTNCFVFDMSVPDTIAYINTGIPVFSRQSEYEPEPAFYNHCAGIWLDAFTDKWYDADLIRRHIDNNKKVAIVSPELHKRNPQTLWNYLKDNNLHNLSELILCTDIPEDAQLFFRKQ